MIMKQIYEGKTAQDLNMPLIQYNSRLDTLNMFLIEWDKEIPFEEAFLWWAAKQAISNKETDVSSETIMLYSDHEDEEDDLTYGAMFKGLAKNIKIIASTGMKLVNNEEHEKRYLICLDCEFFKGKRCRKCGCFMKLKSKFASMDCPEKKWG